jgi:hypothetical protein
VILAKANNLSPGRLAIIMVSHEISPKLQNRIDRKNKMNYNKHSEANKRIHALIEKTYLQTRNKPTTEYI